MPNLSQLRRQKMLGFLDRIRKEHTDDESLAAISEIENALTAKKYGLVWEEHEERADVEMKQGIPYGRRMPEKKSSAERIFLFIFFWRETICTA